VGNGFGEKLRAERLERGLTQAELGKDLYSPSYISLLETGRREPTAEVIEELARRLELAPKALEAWSQPISVSDAEYVLAGLYARQAWDLRDYPSPPATPPTPRRLPWRQKHQRLVEHDLHAGRVPDEARPTEGMPENH
jgi:transcriptional regulator with XRE-family HTH domain